MVTGTNGYIAARPARPIRNNPLRALLVLCSLAWSVPSFAQTHTSHDMIPDFCASPTVTSLQSGNWSNPATWSPARVPAANDVVRVASGTTVTFDTQMANAAACVGVQGTLAMSRTVSTRLWAGTVLVYPVGTLEIGTVAAPMPAGVTAEVVIADRGLDPTFDPDQYGTALIVLGTVRMHGAVRTPTWVRLAAEPRKGQTTLQLPVGASGWDVGDRLILPDTRHLTEADRGGTWMPVAPQWEELTVQAVSADGRTVSVSPALRFDHLGAIGRNGGVEFLPHVGNLTRNVVVRSEVPIGAVGTRGHTMYTDRANVDIRYAWFRDLGRTTIDPLDPVSNHIGRYAVHLHHVMGPTTVPANGYQFTFQGNTVDGGSTVHNLKWGMAIHNSHFGLIQGNVYYNWAGSAVMFEDGSESYNLLDSNFAMRSVGTGDRVAAGTEGGGFWFRGPNNYVRNNVATNLWGDQPESAYGFKYYLRYLGDVKVPNFKGADTSVAGQYTLRDGNAMPILEFTNNEVYAAAQGLTYWWIGTQDPDKRPGYTAVSTFKDLRLWSIFNIGVYHYPAANLVFDGLVIRGIGANSACCRQGWYGGDYAQHDVTIRHADIFNVGDGITVSSVAYGTQIIEDSNVDTIRTTTLYSVNGGSWIPPRNVIVRRSTGYINREWDTYRSGPERFNTTQPDTLKIYAHGGDPAVNFQTYYWEQATQSIAGGLAPCGASRSDVNGITCAIAPEVGGVADTTAPTVGISAPASGATVAGTATLTAAASDNVAVVGVQFLVDGAPVGAEDTSFPYSIAWASTSVSNTSHVISAVARDAAGNSAAAPGVAVTVANAFADTTLPTVSVSAPVAGASVSGVVSLGASAADNVGVVGVQFYIDGVAIGAEVTASPYAVSWSTTTVGNGAHTVTARARDAAGNQRTSAAVSVTVSNAVADTTLPNVNISGPAVGTTVAGVVTVSAAASDNVGVAGVQFYVDGVAVGTEDTTAPYAISWTSNAIANGTHQLSARARDAAGNKRTSANTSVVVSNTVSDATAPTVSLSAPASGATVSGTVTLSATASDNVRVAGVQFYIDGLAVGAEDTSSPYSVSWASTSIANGAHAVTARARDAAGNTRTSSARSVTVSNAADLTKPTVSLSSPTAGSTVTGTVSLTAKASDNVGVAGVQFYVNGVALGAEDTTSPYSASWVTTGLAAGAYSITARARDAAGNSRTSTAISVSVAAVAMSSPTRLRARVRGSNVTWTWQAPTSGQWTGYTLEAGRSSGATESSLPLAGSLSTYTVAVPAGRFYFRLRALYLNGQSRVSNEIYVYMTDRGTPVTSPFDFQVSTAGDAVSLTWEPPPSDEPATTLLDAGSAPGLSDIAAGVPLGNGGSYSVAGVPRGIYYLRLRAANANGDGPPTPDVQVAVGVTPVALPSAPTLLTARMPAPGVVSLRWVAPATGGRVTGYILEAGLSPGATDLVLPLPTAAFDTTGVPAGIYVVRVRAVNEAGIGPASTEVAIRVP